MGTFPTSPSLFSQAYYIHVWDEYSMKAMVYSCCQDKSQQTYINLYQLLVQYAATKNIPRHDPNPNYLGLVKFGFGR